jgi:hypothetical protein
VQLKDIGTVDQLSFEGLEMVDGKAVKDLNDLLRISGEEPPEECEADWWRDEFPTDTE